MSRGAYLLELGAVPYREAWELQRAIAGAVSQRAIPETVILLEHPAVITLGRRADRSELHVPEQAEVEIVETDRGGKSTYHGPGQLVCYPIIDLRLHGEDVKRYVRDLEEALIRTLAPFGLAGRSRRSGSTSRNGSRRTGMPSTWTSIRRRSRSGSRHAGSRTRHSRRWRSS
jgi:lipoyl(octanoyl) transferase